MSLRCESCGEYPPEDRMIREGIYAGGHRRVLSTEEALLRGYPEDPCGPVSEDGDSTP